MVANVPGYFQISSACSQRKQFCALTLCMSIVSTVINALRERNSIFGLLFLESLPCHTNKCLCGELPDNKLSNGVELARTIA